MENQHQPAFPPQVAQDNLGRLIAPIPGMTKLEYAAIQLLPYYLELDQNKQIRHEGKNVTPYQAAVYGANLLFQALNQKQNDTENIQIIE